MSRFVRIVLVMFASMLLTQCTKLIPERHSSVNKQLASPYTMPASAYLALAKNQSGAERSALLIMAAGRSIYDGQWQQAQQILSQTGPLVGDLAAEKSILLAKIELIRNQPRKAISLLASVRNLSALVPYYQIQFHEILASAYQSLGQGAESLVERIKLDELLPDEASKANNRRALWLSLTMLPQADLDALHAEVTDDPVLSGWVELALISRQNYQQPEEMLARLNAWQAAYPHHPALHIMPSPESLRHRLFSTPHNIAVLLPLTGPLAGPGQAIKDGLLAANAASGRGASTHLRFYDTSVGNVALSYQQAIQEGAEYVIGPLTKPDVVAVAKMSHPVPTLLLNEIDQSSSSNAFQFGLSPTNEARQVAVKARKNGLVRALVIAPQGDWGESIVRAFNEQFHANGGQIVDALRYVPQTDLNHSIRDLLRFSEIQRHGKTLKQLQAEGIDVTPRRREDFDMIFLVAYPSKARQIVPLLKYYYAGNVPIYATSSVYTGNVNTMKDRDLDGVIFCDMPWVFTHQMGARNWPEPLNSYNRLYALGLDSYALSTQLNQLQMFPALGVNDKTGVLYLTSSQQIERILMFGQFRQGVPHVMSSR